MVCEKYETLYKIFAKMGAFLTRLMCAMSLSCFSALRRACLFSLILLCCFVLPAHAQHEGGFGGIEDTEFPILGTNGALTVTAGGELSGCEQDCCPFSTAPRGAEYYQAAVAAAKSAGDADGCPFAVDGQNTRIYLNSCRGFYRTMVGKGGEEPQNAPQMACCHLPPASDRSVLGERTLGSSNPREHCKYMNNVVAEYSTAEVAPLYVSTKTLPSRGGVLSTETKSKIQQDIQDLIDAQEQCFNTSWGRITDFWVNHQSVQCAKNIGRVTKALIKDKRQEIINNIKTRKAIGQSASGTGTAGGWLAVAEAAADGIYMMDELINTVSWITETLNESCGDILNGVSKLKEWRETVLPGGCLPVFNLLERQMTQCVRVDLRFDLALPRFNVLLQCPVNINLSVRISPTGFDCWKNMITGSITGNRYFYAQGAGKEVIGDIDKEWSLRDLWDPACHKGTTEGKGVPQNAANNNSTYTVDRAPGFACGPLLNDIRRTEPLNGIRVLERGNASNGWAVGGTETVDGVQITRCDYYDNNKWVRTNYVYGSGSSCNSGQNGFLNGGFETNTSCYSGGYTPATGANIPDICMYPEGCLDSKLNFNPQRLGTNDCPADTKAIFRPDAKGTITVSEGQSGGFNPTQGEPQTKVIDCSIFAENPGNIICCDPQKQDCRWESEGGSRKQGQPMCMCDEGTALNSIMPVLDPQGNPIPGQFDALNRCVEGGTKTCCNAELNGGPEGCVAMGYGDSDMCPDTTPNSCVSNEEDAFYRGPDGRQVDLQPVQLTRARPSPMLYLFIRPDAEIAGQRCCVTEWCNVCPQHYVNAYGLSLIRATPPILPEDDGTRAGDNHNRSLIGRGWPFQESDEDGFGNLSYRVGLDSLPIYYEYTRRRRAWFGTTTVERSITHMPVLHVSTMMRQPANYEACASATRMLAVETPMSKFADGVSMGFTMDVDGRNKKESYITIGGVEEPAEYPLSYMNRLRSQMTDSNGVPLPEIPLCEAVKVCTPSSGDIQLGGGSRRGLGGGSGVPPGATPGTEAVPPRTNPGCAPGDTRRECLEADPNYSPPPVLPPGPNTGSAPQGTAAPSNNVQTRARTEAAAPSSVAPATNQPSSRAGTGSQPPAGGSLY